MSVEEGMGGVQSKSTFRTLLKMEKMDSYVISMLTYYNLKFIFYEISYIIFHCAIIIVLCKILVS